jgi:hypothetical protein
MDDITEAVIAIATMIVGASLLALLVSNKSQTANVISAAANGFSTMLNTALSPVVNNGVSIPVATYH